MFFIRRLLSLFRFYMFILICGLIMVGVDYDMQAKAVGRTIATYDVDSYRLTLQRRLGGEPLRVASDGRVGAPEDEVTSPLDVAFRALRGLAVAKAHVMGQDLEMEQVVLLPPPSATQVPIPQQPQTMPVQDTQEQRPCVRRGNVLDC
jgi:hypothetical protein